MKPLEPRKYPVGIQVFSMIRNEHYLYVDCNVISKGGKNSSKGLLLRS